MENDNENQNQKIRSVRMSAELWGKIDQDAKFMKRSRSKQLEIILEEHYGLRPDSASPEARALQTTA